MIESLVAKSNVAHAKSNTGLKLRIFCVKELTGFQETSDDNAMLDLFSKSNGAADGKNE